MTPGARLAAAIELLAEIDAFERPADQVAGAYTRARRYIGSKDRRALTDIVFNVLRRRAQVDWHLGQAGIEPGARGQVLAYAVLSGAWSAAELTEACDGEAHRPPPLSDPERNAFAKLAEAALDDPGQPPAVAANCPDWLFTHFSGRDEMEVMAELRALAEPAPVDLRVNTLKAGREDVRADLAGAGIASEPTPLSPVGLRCAGRPALQATVAFRDGLIELQDESSQIAALLVGARPGMTVIDYCAGGGGKTLALAARMLDTGRLIACDVDAKRLRPLAARSARAGAHCIGYADPSELEEGIADRVLVDAPCTGSGGWRRHPDARWRLRPDDIERWVGVQREILDAAWPIVRPGGRLVYATCSILSEENEDQLVWFRGRHPEALPVPMSTLWPEAMGGDLPPGLAGNEPWLRLGPALSATDGFFVAVLERPA